MLRKARGFTLFELLIVVAIIGILAALIIPNFTTALQKAKQKATMNDIKTISTAIANYITDHGTTPAQGGTYNTETAFYGAICPFYITVLPLNDQWGNGFRVYCGSAVNGNYEVFGASEQDFLVASLGRDKVKENFTCNRKNLDAGLFPVTKSSDFDKDLIMWNGSWIRAPKTAKTAGE